MDNSKTALNKLTTYSIYFYIIIVMVSGSTGTLGVKLIRIIVAPLLFINFINNLKIIKSSYCTWAILFLLYNILTISSAFYKPYAKEHIFTLAYVIIINVLICQYIYKENIIKQMINAFIFGALLMNIIVFGQNGIMVFLKSRGIETISANTVGFYSAISFLMCIIFLLSKNEKIKPMKKIYAVLAIMFIIFTVFSASRKAFVYVLVPLVIYYIVSGKKPVKTFFNIVIIFVLLASVYIAFTRVSFLYNLVGHRLESMISGLQGGDTDNSTATRMRLIETGMKWFRNNPWKGYGIHNFKALNQYYRNSIYYAHNNYVELLVDCGIIGTVIYYWLYIKILLMAWKNKTLKMPANPIALGIIISFIIAEYGMVTYDDAIYQLIVLILYMFLTMQNMERKQKNK